MLIGFPPSNLKNGGMPARHISSQAFDEILSELGDDPAIPDPHGIRKPPPQAKTPTRPPSQGKANLYTDHLNPIQIKHLVQSYAGPMLLIGLFIAAGVALFLTHATLNDGSQNVLEATQKQISELKKEMALMRQEIDEDIEDLYLAIDEIEVSIHLLNDKKPETKLSNKPQASNQESELRRWRYLGTSQIGSSQQVYFHNGKNQLVFEKGAQVLGDWRLSNIEKEHATLTHSHGKSLVLKASKSE